MQRKTSFWLGIVDSRFWFPRKQNYNNWYCSDGLFLFSSTVAQSILAVSSYCYCYRLSLEREERRNRKKRYFGTLFDLRWSYEIMWNWHLVWLYCIPSRHHQENCHGSSTIEHAFFLPHLKTNYSSLEPSRFEEFWFFLSFPMKEAKEEIPINACIVSYESTTPFPTSNSACGSIFGFITNKMSRIINN